MSNQASGDELRAAVLTEFKQVHKLAPADYTENCTNIVMSLIRTEKLKLLDEVRERVVGEDAGVDAAYKIGFDNGQDATAHNELRADQRAALTKLEGEL